MIKFKQKIYTISEGHYSGPKDEEEELNFEPRVGELSGIPLRVFLNYLHTPASKEKYLELDEEFRKKLSKSELGNNESVSDRPVLDERFSFGDRNITDYCINVVIQTDKITIYTLGLSDNDLARVSDILDYYCKKSKGTGYSSFSINPKQNSWAISISFDNYEVISSIILEISGTLKKKINLIGQEDKKEIKTFSLAAISKFDLIDILSGAGKIMSIAPFKMTRSNVAAYIAMFSIMSTLLTLRTVDKTQAGLPQRLEDLNNKFLDFTLKKLHYVDRFHYTTGENENSPVQMSLVNGRLLITATNNSPEVKEIDNKFWRPMSGAVTRSEAGKVVIYSYQSMDKKKCEAAINMFMKIGLKPNIFEEALIK